MPDPSEPGQAAVEGEVVWRPSPARQATSEMQRYLAFLAGEGRRLGSYGELHAWSVADLEGFWASIWRFFGVRAAAPYERVLADDRMPGARWFPGARLNYAEHCLRHPPDDSPAIVAFSEATGRRELSWRALHTAVGSLEAWLVDQGVGPGDRVAGYLPNIPEAIVAFLATAALGATWSQCSPDFGPASATDRLRQFDPQVLVAADGYVYAGRRHDRREAVGRLARSLPGLRRAVCVDVLGTWDGGAGLPDAVPWSRATSSDAAPRFMPVAAEHPLWVLYSSGTTGPPKGIVHGHAGMLLEHLKQQALHLDLRSGDRFAWFTTTGWMMWNVVVSSLLLGCTAMLYDGAPGYPDPSRLWRWAGEEGVTFLGTSAAYLAASMQAGARPRDEADLAALRTLGVTGSPVAAEAFAWVYRAVAPDIALSNLSGGTDVCSGLLGANPFAPVRAGEFQGPLLGVAADVVDGNGRPLLDEPGELVVTRPMPSMPVALLNDPDGARLRDSYFAHFPGVWRHGDWARRTRSGGFVIHGRSDATLNRHGVRIGSAEIYRVVDAVPEVADSLVVDLEGLGGASRMYLFVAPAPGVALDERLRGELRRRLREALSPRHVPDEIVAVAEVPRTLNGKRVEVPVRRILRGEPPDRVVSPEALSSPASLEPFVALARTLGVRRPRGADR